MNMFLIKKRQVYYNFNNKNRRINEKIKKIEI